MPKYILPEPKKPKKQNKAMLEAESIDSMRWRRRLTLPVNKSILDEVDIGEEVEITLKAKVTELSSRENEDGKKDNTLEVDLVSVEVYGNKESQSEFENEYEK